MDRERLSLLAHASHPIAAPIGDDAVEVILRHAVARPDGLLLDVGCGTAEWSVRALGDLPEAVAIGVDTSAPALQVASARARERGVDDRLTLVPAPAAEFRPGRGPDTILCIGATHALGGFDAALGWACDHLAPGGTVVIGDGYWSREPTDDAIAVLGDQYALPEMLRAVAAQGWAIVHGHCSSSTELDAYEWAWSGALARWSLDNLADPDSAAVAGIARHHLETWFSVLRGQWGFACLVLRRPA